MASRRWICWFLAFSILSFLPAIGLGQAATPDRKAKILALAKKIDELIAKKWQEAKVTGAGPAEPGTLFRRLSLDLTGRIPDCPLVDDFIENDDPNKRWEWAERYVNEPTYAKHFAAIFRSIMLGDNLQQQFQFFSPQFEGWLKDRLNNNVRYDKLVHELITAGANPNTMYQQGNGSNPGAFFFVNENKPENLAGAVTRVFLGVKLECAQCHKHPFAEWTREQFWEFAAFFAGAQRVNFDGNVRQAPLDPNARSIKIPGSNKTVNAKFINGHEPSWKDGDSPRTVLANWVTAPDNPYFAKALVDHVWGYFFGVSLLEPILEASDDSPITHPELLDEMAREFVEQKYDLKFLIQAIVLTDAYARASTGKEKASKEDYNLFLRMPVRGMTPEQLFDSLADATFFEETARNANMGFNQFGQPNTLRAQFLTRFTSQDRRHETQTSILQALFLMNGKFMAERIDPEKNRYLKTLVYHTNQTPAQKIASLYKIVLTRLPTQEETGRLVRYVESVNNPARAYPDIYWALLNSAEFMLNH